MNDQNPDISETARTVHLSASAGSGKTRALKDRYLALLDLLDSRGLGIDQAVAITFTDKAAAEIRERVREKLALVGLRDVEHLWPAELSGGEMQRVAIARALVNKPEILLADEPTGNLDSKRTREIGEVIQRLNREEGLTVLLVTHNPDLARIAHRAIELRDGRIHVDSSS